jgi:hypothetical protein
MSSFSPSTVLRADQSSPTRGLHRQGGSRGDGRISEAGGPAKAAIAMMTNSGGVTGARQTTTLRSPLSTSLCADSDYGLLKH